jgi:thiol-disulfide isomerase/thioredoxin
VKGIRRRFRFARPAGCVSLFAVALPAIWLISGCGGEAAPAGKVDLGSIDGPGLTKLVEQHRGQVVLVDFWATWCEPCVAFLPYTIELYDRLRPRGLAVITVSLDQPETRLAVLKFLVDHRATTDNYLAPYGASSAAVAAFHIDDGTLPHARLYDRRGKLYRSFAGNIRADEVHRAVEELLSRG